MIKLLKPLFEFIWTLWCSLAFLTVILPIFPFFVLCVNLPGKRMNLLAHKFPCFASRMVLFLWGIRPIIEGENHINRTQQLVFVINHRSYLDALLSSAIIKNHMKYLGKAEILEWPVLGYIVRKLYIPVKRQDPDKRTESKEKMFELFYKEDKPSMFLAPESTCNTGKEFLADFKTGAFQMAISAQVPMAVLTIINAGELFPRKGFVIRPGKLYCYWARPVETQGMNLEDMHPLIERVRNIMKSRLREHYPDGRFP